MSEKTIQIVGWVATFTAILMYVSYLPQIMDNLAGQKGNPIQPLSAAINCTLWVGYGFFKRKKDWPIMMANLPGIILGTLAFITAI